MKLKTLFAVAAAGLLSACLGDTTGSGTINIPAITPLPAGVDTVTTATGLKYADITVGTGTLAEDGRQVAVHYTGWLAATGEGFDTSQGFQPLGFTLGAHQVVAGFEQGVVGMKVGGKRRLIIPAALGYGANEVRDQQGRVVIPANSALIFDVSLIAVAN
ncbi:MAG TPA: FKBP-type peptidyl-prolyl cis-trans isomerase [Longimicrobium sp.]|nr:FKBP-type peptidyl-prolyl cis-trans isomerase [Longimicrobium sp.]